MSNNKKKKQNANKKRMNPETKAKILTGFKTLLSNDACRDAAREWKGASQSVPIIFAILATVIALTPTLVTQMQVRGSSSIYAAPTAEFDIGLATFTYRLAHDETGSPLAQDKIVHVSWDEKGNMTTQNLDQLYHQKEATVKHWYCLYDSFDTEPVFEVFFSESFKNADGTYKYDDDAFFSMLNRNTDPDDPDGNTRSSGTTPSCSFIAFGQKKIAFRKYINSGHQEGLYDRLAGKDLASFVPASTIPFMSKSYKEAIKKSWTEYIDLSYETTKIRAAWTFTGIMGAVDFGMILLFGALLFVMTRGKNNPYRIINMWETMKMAGFASLTPAIITLALGFWLTQYAYLIFMFTYGLRMMWMSMKSLRPAIQ